MNFSIIGTGFIMPRHAEAIHHVGGNILDVVNESQGPHAWREAIERPDTDCIVILTPNDLHFEMARAAAELGKTVLCEKPLALTEEEAAMLARYPSVFSVLQLRHHPVVRTLQGFADHAASLDIEMDISVYRDRKYYEGWKGDVRRSGGILFNLGSHYFDALIHVFGAPSSIEWVRGDERRMEGMVEGPRYRCHFHITTDAPRNAQRRCFTVNGTSYHFSSQDNLSYENLHRKVYEDLMADRGVRPSDVLPSTRLIGSLYAHHRKEVYAL